MLKGRGRGRSEHMALRTITGYVTQLPSTTDDQSDDEEEDEDNNWLDYSEIETAFDQGNFIQITKKAQYGRVTITDHKGQKHSVYGRFVLTDPWWDLTVHVGHKNRVSGVVEYALRSDQEGIQRHNLLPMVVNKSFQQEIKEAYEPMTAFENFLKQEDLQNLNFEQLESVLWKFACSTSCTAEHAALTHSILRGDTLQSVFRSQHYPQLLQFLCRLFPLSFLNSLLRPSKSVLPELQDAARTEPWVFGFRRILTRRFRVYGVEADCKAFTAAGLMQQIPRVERDALHIYEVLKTDAAKDGHTYISFPDLREHRHWAQLDYKVSDWLPALTFLCKNEVTVEERFQLKRNIFLHHNWKAEVDIADGLKTVLNRGIMGCEPAWDVDFSSPDLNCLRGDKDQWQAAQKLTASPVCIMSGKGGCGKTTVVTCLLQHVCLRDSMAPECESMDTPRKENQDSDNTLPPSPADCNAQDESFRPCPVTPSSHLTIEKKKTPSSSSSQPAPPHVTPEQVSSMVDSVLQSLRKMQSQTEMEGKPKSKKDELKVDLTVDLIRYLGTSGDTALSQTPAGKTMLLLAPTGKAAKLLGNKAKMESSTLHHVIYSYRAYVKAQHKNRRLQEAVERKQGPPGEENAGSNETPRKLNHGGRKNAGQSGKGAANNKSGSNTSTSFPTEDTTWKYADTEVVVVDECSLVSLRLFATLLNILIKNTPLHKVILLGDVRQLPSIEPGNFLSDVFTSFKERGFSVELSTNHRSESELIVSNAARISSSHLPFFDPARHFQFCPVVRSKDSVDPERDAAIRELLNQPELRRHESSQFVAFRRAHCDFINELCCQHYNNHSTHCVTDGGKPRLDFRIGDKVCFRKNGQVNNNAMQLRRYLQDFSGILEAFGITKPKDKKQGQSGQRDTLDVSAVVAEVMQDGDGQIPVGEARHADHAVETTESPQNGNPRSQSSSEGGVNPRRQLRFGDGGAGAGKHSERYQNSGVDGQVCATQPDTGRKAEDEEEKAEKLKNGDIRLCNGEVFFIMDEFFLKVNDVEHRYLVLSDRDLKCPRVVCCSHRALMRHCHMRHSWARTIHTYQGSESDTVVYYVGESVVQNWKHVYTAVTRGRQAVFMVGEMDSLQQAVRKKPHPRRSRLGNRLSDRMKEVDFQKLHAAVRQINELASAALLGPPTPTPDPTLAASQGTTTTTLLDSCRTALIDSFPDTSPAGVARLDSFPDSDDSWITNMSPVWTADYRASKETPSEELASTAASAASGYREPGGCIDDEDDDEALGTDREKGGDGGAGWLSPSPTKRQHSAELELPTPTKRTRTYDAVDSIVTPVKRNLNI